MIFLGRFVIAPIFDDIGAIALWTTMDFNADDHDVSPDLFSVENIPHQSNLTITSSFNWPDGRFHHAPKKSAIHATGASHFDSDKSQDSRRNSYAQLKSFYTHRGEY
jgi:hypothetical protein